MWDIKTWSVAQGLSVDLALVDPELLTLHLPLPTAEPNITSCIFIHKIVNNVNIGFWYLHNQLKFIYCSPEWVKKYDTSFWLSNYSVFFTENKLKCNREFLRTPFPQWAESLSAALHGASPPPQLVCWAPSEVLQYQNRANSLKRNVGIILTHAQKDENKTGRTDR